MAGVNARFYVHIGINNISNEHWRYRNDLPPVDLNCGFEPMGDHG